MDGITITRRKTRSRPRRPRRDARKRRWPVDTVDHTSQPYPPPPPPPPPPMDGITITRRKTRSRPRRDARKVDTVDHISQPYPPPPPPMDGITITRRKTRSRPRRDARKKRSSVDKVDHISQLPNELLITILSSMTMKEAGRTSLLSKRWKKLWTYYYGFLDFDIPNLPLINKFDYTTKFIDFVNKVLTCHRSVGIPINKLSICWLLHGEFTSDINSWIDFAMNNRVQHVELDIYGPKFWGRDYEFPLENLMIGIGFPNLNVLQLKSVNLTDETLTYLFSSDKFPSLQHISVHSARSLVHVKLVGNLKLKSLEFVNCWEVKDVEISSAINMVSFGFRGQKLTKITFEDVPLLTEANFAGHCTRNVARFPFAQQLSSFLSQLEILILDFSDMAVCSYRLVSQFPKFDRVKRLEVVTYNPPAKDLNMCVMAMIYGCPRLQKLSLKMIYTGRDWKYELGFIFQKIHYEQRHECLQAVEYIGWNGNKDDLELIIDIVKNTVLLEKITIDPRATFLSKEYELRENRWEKEFMKREKGARKAAKKLRRILPQRVSLVVL